MVWAAWVLHMLTEPPWMKKRRQKRSWKPWIWAIPSSILLSATPAIAPMAPWLTTRTWWASSTDNGEPSGTAGKPILGQINSFGLTDIVVVVVRYFGGIKLGTSGLIAAYREAARDAISQAEIIECHDTTDISFHFPYLSMNAVMKLTKNGEAEIVSQIFDNSCSMTLRIRSNYADGLRTRLTDIDGVTLD